ncbi:unnamed protein product [Amaranthus hypochondriacus]
MQQDYTFLANLTDRSTLYRVKVRVIEKSRPFQSPEKKKYQRLVLQDTQGSVMKATLFEDDITAYDTIIKQNYEYIISNATIKPVDPRYQTRENEFQMTINNRTIIQPTCTESQESVPQYHTIASLPRMANTCDRFDILGIIIFVSEVRQVKGAFARQNSVCDIFITDHSSHQPLTILAWNDLSCFFDNSLDSNPIVGFTSLKLTSHKGFGLGTTMSTNIILEPTGDKANTLRQWAFSHANLLSERRYNIMQTQKISYQQHVCTIDWVKSKTASNTIQEERHWIKAFISNFSYADVRKFLACSNCNTKTYTEKNFLFNCPTCYKKDCTSIPRLVYNKMSFQISHKLTVIIYSSQISTKL